MDRKEALNALQSLYSYDGEHAISGSYKLTFLKNFNTYEYCQIIEATDNDGKQLPMPPHRHLFSKELFYQLIGKTVFDDGVEIGPGEVRIIEPGVIHSAYLTPGAKCIVIVHPADTNYPTGV